MRPARSDGPVGIDNIDEDLDGATVVAACKVTSISESAPYFAAVSPVGRWSHELASSVMPQTLRSTEERQLYLLLQYPALSQTFIRNEVQGLRARGVDVDVVTLEGGESANIDPKWAGEYRGLARPRLTRALRDHVWFVVRHPADYRRFVGAIVQVREYWRTALQRLPTEARRLRAAGRTAGCHTHFGWPHASLSVYLARLLGTRASVTVHANDIYVGDQTRLRARLKQFDRIVTVCSFNVGVLNGYGIAQVGSGEVDIVPCGVSVPSENEVELRRLDVISVARLIEKKGFETLIRAMALVRARIPEARLVIVGDGPERAGLSHLISSLRLEGTVTLTGALGHHATLELMDQAKLFCLASERARDGDCDALPVVIREAMARGLPVISTRVAGIPETVDDEVGWIVDPRSPDQLADAIVAALSDNRERHARGRAGRARVLTHWTVDAQVRGVLEAFARRDRA